MSKFWNFVAVLFLLSIALVVVDKSRAGITFTDLETECRYDRSQEAVVELKPDNSLGFEGHYPLASTRADLSLDYSQDRDSVTLNVEARNVEEVEDYSRDCQGVAVYDTDTRPLEPGRYMVRVKHDGDLVKEQVIAVR
ncbi:MAG: hypothetical protein ABEI58_01880 [Candidatus Nanohaloarchaea archaeon]